MSVTAFLAEVLFVGHALVGAQLPAMVQRAAAAQQIELRAEWQVIDGAPLMQNWTHSAAADGIDGRRALDSRRFDHLVLTEALPLAEHLHASRSGDYARQWADLARNARPGAQVWIYETWHSLNSGTAMANPQDTGAGMGWRQRLDEDWPAWLDIAAAAGPDVRVIPAGQAMGALADAISAGTVPGLRDISDVFSDDIHLNDRGNYMVAMVMHASLTGRDPRGLPRQLVRQWASRTTVVSEDMAQRMQQIAWQVVQNRKVMTPPAPLARPAAVVEAAITPTPVIQPPPLAHSGVTVPGIGFGLAGINDWSVQQPFLDVMKTARPWAGHLPDRWGAWGHDELAAGGWLDADGWPRAIPPELTGIATLVLTDLPADTGEVAGRYVLTYQGRGEIQLQGRAQNIEPGPGRITFDYTPGEGGVLLTLTAIDATDPIRAIQITRAGREHLLAAGQIFNPDWLARIRGAQLIRFMDWMQTNHSRLSALADRPKPGDYTWARLGVPPEIMIALANELRADPWLTLPHLGSDELFRAYAQIVHRDLAPGLRAHVEFSNEVWNWGFAQAQWAEDQARARWGGKEWNWVQFYALRASEMAAIWAQVFADDPARLVRVLATQTVWHGLEDGILDAPLVIAEGRPQPASQFDAWAITGYFSGGVGGTEAEAHLRRWLADSRTAAATEAARLGLAGATRDAHIARHRFDLAVQMASENMLDGRHSGDARDTVQTLLRETIPYHLAVARRHGLQLMMYEGGTHALGNGPLQEDPEITAFMAALNYSPQMGALYRQLIDGWAAQVGTPFNAFVDVMAQTKWGSWGALRHLGDDSPRWRAIAAGE